MHERLIDLIHFVFRIHLGDRARPGAGVEALGKIALARAKLQRIQRDQPGLRARLLRGFERMPEQMVRAGKTRMRGVHGGSRYAREPKRAGRALRLAGQRMRLMRQLVALGGVGNVDEHVAFFDLHRKRGYAIFLVARLALAGDAVEFPVVPRTNDVVAVEAAFAERPADVIAGMRHRAELPVLERERDRRVFQFDRAA